MAHAAWTSLWARTGLTLLLAKAQGLFDGRGQLLLQRVIGLVSR